jgi:hypothetical protein
MRSSYLNALRIAETLASGKRNGWRVATGWRLLDNSILFLARGQSVLAADYIRNSGPWIRWKATIV